MDCAGCAMKIENALRRVPGVEQVEVSVARGTVTVNHHKTNSADIKSRISGLGYVVTGVDAAPTRQAGHDHPDEGTASEVLAGPSTSTIMDPRANDGGKPARPV